MSHEIVVPRLGWSMDEGTFVGWLKKDGEHVRSGEALFELEGEKGIQEIEAVDEGILRLTPQSPAPGTVVPVGKIIGFLAGPNEALPSSDGQEESSPAKTVEPPAAPPAALPAGPAARRMARKMNASVADVRGSGSPGQIPAEDIQRPVASPRDGAGAASAFGSAQSISIADAEPSGRGVASPRARRVAQELNIDWTRLAGSGRGGRIRECDVRAAAESPAQPASGNNIAAEQRLPITRRRRVIAERMTASRQQTAPVTLTTRADATNLVNLREQFKTLGGAPRIPSYQDFIVKLVAGALQRRPVLAAQWDDGAIVTPASDAINIRIAVDADAGLLAPVIRNVPALSIGEIAEASRRLIERSQSGRIAAAELEGGVFTISNLGAFGIDAFTPIINLPEAAILGLGAIRREAVVADDGQIIAIHQITLSLTFDHRIVDGAPAAKFLQDVANAIANPSAWLLKTNHAEQ